MLCPLLMCSRHRSMDCQVAYLGRSERLLLDFPSCASACRFLSACCMSGNQVLVQPCSLPGPPVAAVPPACVNRLYVLSVSLFASKVLNKAPGIEVQGGCRSAPTCALRFLRSAKRAVLRVQTALLLRAAWLRSSAAARAAELGTGLRGPWPQARGPGPGGGTPR